MLANKLNAVILEDLDVIISSNLPWDQFKNKTFLIAGANGFLPSYFVYTLLHLNDKRNYNIKVIALVRNKEKAIAKFSSLMNRSDFELLIQDVSIEINTNSNIDYIIHAASKGSPKYYGNDPVGIIHANVLGTNNLLQLAKNKVTTSFLFISSGEVYGQVDDVNIPTKENQYGYIDPLNVRSCYAESKRLAETLCVGYYNQFQTPAKIARPFHTYGPGIELNDGRVYADFINNILSNSNIVIKSDGSDKRAFCYITDAILGCFYILMKGENGQAYNVGNQKEEVSIKVLAETLCSLFPQKNLKTISEITSTSKNYLKSPIHRNCPDTSLLESLGWQSSISIESGFERTIKSYL